MSAGKYIDKYNAEQAKERLDELFKSKIILRMFNDLRDICDFYYEGKPNIRNDTKDAFYQKVDLSNTRKQFLDLYREEIPDESLNWIYKTFAYIETNINNIISKE